MDKIEIRLNDFLFNSGVVGFYRILEKCDKTDLIKIEKNRLIVNPKVFENFEEYYFSAMIEEFEKDTKWHKITSKIQDIIKFDLKDETQFKIFKEYVKQTQEAMNSQSYIAGYEIIKKDNLLETPYEYTKKLKLAKEPEEQREKLIECINFLIKYKEVFCFKDIVYNKINIFWENLAFLNRSSNKNNMKDEYTKVFVQPVNNYIATESNSDYCCIECGNSVGKTEAKSLAWLKDIGVDIKKKNSHFWNFNEDAFLCPICALIYSCVPMGFVMIKSNGIFINDNENIEWITRINNNIRMSVNIKEDSLENMYQNIFYIMLEQSHKIGNDKSAENEQNNIQVVQRIAEDRDNIKYKFNIISKDKLRILEKSSKNFEHLLKINIHIISKDEWLSIYDRVVENFLENKKQYHLINLLISNAITNNESIDYIKYILDIQLYSIGGINVNELQENINKIRYAGKKLNEDYKISGEDNKLKTYVFNLNNALRVNNVSLFMEIVTRMYCGLGKDIPVAQVFASMLSDNEKFKLYGYAYILGLKQKLGEENKKQEGGKKDE